MTESIRVDLLALLENAFRVLEELMSNLLTS